MSLRLGDTAPDFHAETTHGRISFHDCLGDQWGLLFSHPYLLRLTPQPK